MFWLIFGCILIGMALGGYLTAWFLERKIEKAFE